MIVEALQFIQWAVLAAIFLGMFTLLWGFGVDIPRLRVGKEMVRLDGFNFTHHWFEHPMYFTMGLPIGAVSLLLAEYVSVTWGAFIILLGVFQSTASSGMSGRMRRGGCRLRPIPMMSRKSSGR